jgi:hypothetical protein
MSKREDIETLRRWAREDQNGTGWFERSNVAQVVRRLFSGNGDPLIKFAGSDLAGLRRALDDVPMTTRQREGVGRWLGKLQSAMETETREPDEGERAAVRAIETLSRYLGGIDELWHNYQLAARIGKDACKAMMRIRAACPTYDTSKGTWADAEEQAVMALKALRRIGASCPARDDSRGLWVDVTEQAIAAIGKLKDHARIIQIKENWQKDDAEDEPIAGARHRAISFLRALTKPACQDNPLLTRAFGDVINLLDHVAGDEIPF